MREMLSHENEVLSQDEIEKVILALGHGQEKFTEEDMLLAVEWARHNRIAQSCLNLVLSGRIALRIISGEACMVLPDDKRKELDSNT